MGTDSLFEPASMAIQGHSSFFGTSSFTSFSLNFFRAELISHCLFDYWQLMGYSQLAQPPFTSRHVGELWPFLLVMIILCRPSELLRSGNRDITPRKFNTARKERLHDQTGCKQASSLGKLSKVLHLLVEMKQ